MSPYSQAVMTKLLRRRSLLFDKAWADAPRRMGPPHRNALQLQESLKVVGQGASGVSLKEP
jgi:hypothetical protein